MARKPTKPWYRAARGEWYATIRGTTHRLGPDEDEATRKFHALMAEAPEAPPVSQDSVASIGDQFLDHIQARRAPRTYSWYRDFWRDLCNYSSVGSLSVMELRVADVEDWLASKPAWGPSTRRGAITAISGALRWAERRGMIPRNPIAAIERPAVQVRDNVVPQAHYKYMLETADKPLRDLLTVAWETGARPNELLRAEAKHLDAAQGVLLFGLGESKGKRRRRIIYLPSQSLKIVRRLADAYPTGQIFRNADGRPWTRSTLAKRFDRYTSENHLNTRYCLYDFRHTFATRMLKAGMDSVVLANIMGHVDTGMISRVYGHLQKDPGHMRAILDAAEAAAAQAACDRPAELRSAGERSAKPPRAGNARRAQRGRSRSRP